MMLVHKNDIPYMGLYEVGEADGEIVDIHDNVIEPIKGLCSRVRYSWTDPYTGEVQCVFKLLGIQSFFLN